MLKRVQGAAMTQCPRLVPVLLTIAAFAASGLAQAAEPDPAAAVATQGAASPAAPAGPSAAPQAATAPAPLTIGEQIDNYIRTSPAAVLPKDNAAGVVSGDEPRQVHGMVDVAAGSNGYRSTFVASELPIGKTGTATIAVGETQFKGRFGGGYGGPGYDRFGPQSSQSLALGLSLSGADPSCRQAAQDGAVNLDPRFGGGRACRTATPPPP
jgi:hypothetical protein